MTRSRNTTSRSVWQRRSRSTLPKSGPRSTFTFAFANRATTRKKSVGLADRVERCLADGLETYAFFKHEEDPRSPLNAVELFKTVQKRLGIN